MLFYVRACVRTMLLSCVRVHKFIIADANVMVAKSSRRRRREKNFAHHANNSEVAGGGGVNLNSDALKMNIFVPIFEYFFRFYVHIAHYMADLAQCKTVNESTIYDMLQSTKKPVLR